MPTFRVFGRKYQDYQTEVIANDEYHAIEIANQLETHKWYEIKTDDVIESVDVYLDEDISMDSGIMTRGK